MRKNIVKEFKNYTDKFDNSDAKIILKINHSIRVMKLANKISKRMKLNKEDVLLAKLIGLLHDYARFPQWEKYKTFDDFRSIDHGDLGAKLLIDNLEIKKFSDNSSEYEIIRNAVKNHNKKIYAHNLDERTILHCNIIRDVDKIDIFNIFAIGLLKLESSQDELSEKIIKDFYDRKQICKKEVYNVNDSLLLTLSMIFDINYKDSYKYIYNKNLLWKIYDRLDYKEKFLEYFKYVDCYIKERLK